MLLVVKSDIFTVSLFKQKTDLNKSSYMYIQYILYIHIFCIIYLLCIGFTVFSRYTKGLVLGPFFDLVVFKVGKQIRFLYFVFEHSDQPSAISTLQQLCFWQTKIFFIHYFSSFPFRIAFIYYLLVIILVTHIGLLYYCRPSM